MYVEGYVAKLAEIGKTEKGKTIIGIEMLYSAQVQQPFSA